MAAQARQDLLLDMTPSSFELFSFNANLADSKVKPAKSIKNLIEEMC
jgi:hypothetical protein